MGGVFGVFGLEMAIQMSIQTIVITFIFSLKPSKFVEYQGMQIAQRDGVIMCYTCAVLLLCLRYLSTLRLLNCSFANHWLLTSSFLLPASMCTAIAWSIIVPIHTLILQNTRIPHFERNPSYDSKHAQIHTFVRMFKSFKSRSRWDPAMLSFFFWPKEIIGFLAWPTCSLDRWNTAAAVGQSWHPLLRSGRKCWSPLASATKGTPKDPKRNSYHHDYIIVS